jgi:thiol-disulfide isomerase/thioredoxin
MEQGMSNVVLPVAAAFVGLIGLVGSVVYYGSRWVVPEAASPVVQSAILASPVSTISNASTTATSSAALLPFNEAEYEAARLEGKVILLYFTASWCPECDYAQMRLEEVVAGWPGDKVEVFMVDYVDRTASSTDPEAKLAENFTVTAPDTKVLLRGEKVIKQSTEVWTLERYREEVAALLK